MISIDPGKSTGWAEWRLASVPGHSILHECGLNLPRSPGQYKGHVVIERPTIYPRSPVPPNDVIDLAITAGRIAATFPYFESVEWVLPRQWKGTVPKDVMAERIIKALLEDEREIYFAAADKVPPGVRHNIIDAIGIGLWKLKRLPK